MSKEYKEKIVSNEHGEESCQLYAINGTEIELITTTKTGVAWIGKAGQVQYWRDLNRTALKQKEKNIYKQEKEERTAIYQYTGDIETVLQDDIWMIGMVEGQGGLVKLNTETAEAEVVETEECEYLEKSENQIIIAKEEDERIFYTVDTKTKKLEKIPNSSYDWLGLYEGATYTSKSQEDGTYMIYKDGKEYGKWGEMTGIQYAQINQKGIYVFTYGAKDSKLYKMPW